MELDNQSNWQATVVPGWSYQGQWQHTLVIKAGYRYEPEGRLTPLETSRDLVAVDEYRGEPEASSVSRAADLAPFKQGFDLLVQGRVEPIPDRNVQPLGVSLVRRGQPSWTKKLALIGPRVWKYNLLLGPYPSEPGPLEAVDVCWENAFGGISENGEARFDNNPAGQGWAKRLGRNLKGQAVPQIDMKPFITQAGKHFTPAGFGPIAPHWGERYPAFETLDNDKAQEGGCPYTQATPENLFNCAPKDQQWPKPPQAGDRLLLEHWYPEHPAIDIALPEPAIQCMLMAGDQPVKALQPHWDTLTVDTTEQELHLLFRVSLNESDLPDGARLCLTEFKATEPSSPEEETVA